MSDLGTNIFDNCLLVNIFIIKNDLINNISSFLKHNFYQPNFRYSQLLKSVITCKRPRTESFNQHSLSLCDWVLYYY